MITRIMSRLNSRYSYICETITTKEVRFEIIIKIVNYKLIIMVILYSPPLYQ